MQTQHMSTSHCFSLTSPTTWIITNSEQIRYGLAVDVWGKNACGQVLRGSHCNSWNGIADLNLRMNRSSKTFLLLVLSSPADHILGFCEDMGLLRFCRSQTDCHTPHIHRVFGACANFLSLELFRAGAHLVPIGKTAYRWYQKHATASVPVTISELLG